MKRVGNLWPRVTAFDTLLEATRRAARGKRGQDAVARFLADREPRLLELQRELRTGTYCPGPLTSFVIHDPKRRTIAVAPFRDRVVHHGLIDVLEPVLDRRMIHASFACRRGKGTHAALVHVQRLVRRHAWVLRMDVERFFASIPQAVVMRTIGSVVKDRAVLSLVERIVAVGGGGDAPGRGLPIGNLTSQWLANLVLDPVDRLVTQRLRLPGYARYMDDWAVLADDRARLREARAAIEDELATLGLRAKPRATMLGRTRDGVPWLGFSVFPAIVRVRPANRRRVVRRWKHRLWQWRHGQLDDQALADAMRSVMAHLEHGTTRGWRRRWCAALEGRGPV
ncbi:MAG: group II intron reverse transcriptase domain-containing protein [Myxococcales bacterium]|nr:group II intron reverse transcriptase domain-containing protein [Myxococcales bacterium]